MANWRRNRRERLSGYLYSALLMLTIAAAVQVLLQSDDNPGRPMTVEAVLTPAPVPEPAPATEPRPANR